MIKTHRSKKNLLNYKYSCQIIDGDPTSKDYFRIQEIPSTLFVGKNLLKIFPNKNTLAPNSKIYIEILDANGEPIYHEILKSTPSDNSKYIVIYIYPDTPIGEASIILGGRARIDNVTGKEILYSNSTISENYKDNMNLMWTGRFSVSNTLQNNSEVFFSKDPIIDFSEKQIPYYTISSLNSNQTKLYSSPSCSLSLQSVITPFQNSEDSSRYSDVFFDSSKKMSIDPILNADGTGTTRELADLPRYSDLSTIYAQNFTFTPEMEGGIIYVNEIDLSSKTPSDANDVSLFSSLVNYSSSIVQVLNSNTIRVDKSFYHKIKYTTTSGVQKEIAFTSFLNQTNVTSSFYSTNNLNQTPATESFVSFIFRDAEPNVGTVDKVKIKYKPIGSFGEFIDVGEFQILEQNLFVDESVIIQSPRNGLIEKQIGFPKNQTDVNTYWETNLTNYPGTVNFLYNTSRIIDSFYAQHAGINSPDKYILITPTLEFPAESETEYKIKFLSNTIEDASASFSPQLDVYISGSQIQIDNIKNDNNLQPIRNNSFGTYIGTVNRVTGRISENEFFFKTTQKKNITPIFVIRSGNWNIGQIGIYPRKEIGFSPNHIKINVPVTLFRRQVELLIHVDYLNENGIKANTYSKIYGAYFDGGNVVITGRDNQFTGSFSGSYGGDGRTLITSWSRIEGIPDGLISSSIDTSSFAHKTEITGAFTLLSSSFTTTYLKSELTSSFVTNSQTSSFALKTDISGAFDVTSGSLGNRITAVENFSTGSFIRPPDTSSFAIKTNITGAFNSLSSSFVNDYPRNELTRSFVNSPQTGGFATTGSNSFYGNQYITGTGSIGIGTPAWANSAIRIITPNTSSAYYMLLTANSDNTRGVQFRNDGHIDFSSMQGMSIPYSRGYPTSSVSNRTLFYNAILQRPSFYDRPVITGNSYVTIDSTFSNAGINFPEMKNILWGIGTGRWTATTSGSNVAGSNWKVNYVLSPHVYNAGSGLTYPGGNAYFSFWANGTPETINFRLRNSSGTWFSYTTSTNLFISGTDYFGFMQVDINPGPNYFQELEVQYTNSISHATNPRRIEYMPNISDDLLGSTPLFDKSRNEYLYNPIYGINTSGTQSYAINSTSGWVLNNLYVTIGSASQQIGQQFFLKGRSGVSSIFKIQASDGTERQNLTDAGSYYLTSSFNLLGNAAFSSSLVSWNGYRVLTSNDTSSFAIKTNITGAFNSLSSSFVNDYPRNELTRSFVNNSSTSSFAIKTDITGAFTTLSSSITTRTTTLENKVYVSASRDSHILISNNTTTGSYTSEGLRYFKETVAAPTQSVTPWGIFKVEGECTQAGTSFGEFELAGYVNMKEDISKIEYLYGVSIPNTQSVVFYLDFPIFKNNLTGSAYTDGRSRYGVMSAEINVMVFASASSGVEKVFAQNWKSRFKSTALSFTQVNDAVTSSYGADPGYDSYFTIATTMGAGITVSASMLRVPCTFQAADFRSYSLRAAATCQTIKFEIL